jgi:hypothetical protein
MHFNCLSLFELELTLKENMLVDAKNAQVVVV